MNGDADRGRRRGSQGVDPGRVPIDFVEQAIGDNIGHAQPHAVAVTVRVQIANEEADELWRVRPGIVFAVHAAIDDLGIHSRAADGFADLVEDEQVRIGGNLAHPGLGQLEQFLFALLHRFDRHSG